jgi:hypothetical protein
MKIDLIVSLHNAVNNLSESASDRELLTVLDAVIALFKEQVIERHNAGLAPYVTSASVATQFSEIDAARAVFVAEVIQ